MVKSYNVKQYITSGIDDNITNCEDAIECNYYEQDSVNTIIVEFIDYSMGGNKSKFKISIEIIDD